MEHEEIVVLGCGESGAGAAVLAKKKGLPVFVSDSSTIKPAYKALLEEYGIPYEEKQHTEERIWEAREVIKSPGISDKTPVVEELIARGTPVISEIEFAGRYISDDTVKICITGTNGKTTTSLLTYEILKAGGCDVALAGNVGKSLAMQVAERDHKVYVIELSSFQLDGMYDFKANISVLLNITSDHLERYNNSLRKYIDSKLRILQNQGEFDICIFPGSDMLVAQEVIKKQSKVTIFPFGLMKSFCVPAYLEDSRMVVDVNGYFSMEQDLIPLPGQHNLCNVMAATLIAKLVGIPNRVIRKTLLDFKGVEHRMERVGRVKGVEYINDSKATNVNSCWYALQSIKAPIVLIMGGVDKGNDYQEIIRLIKRKCRGLVFLGADNSKLHNFFDRKVEIVRDAKTMEEAVWNAYEIAEAGDTVLLSPCCASFDLFRNFEDRGERFKDCVKRL
jgi:UDP-N-acetylmuramoylalanine--D-glutamate ligase